MNLSEYQWIFININELQRIAMNINDYQWIRWCFRTIREPRQSSKTGRGLSNSHLIQYKSTPKCNDLQNRSTILNIDVAYAIVKLIPPRKYMKLLRVWVTLDWREISNNSAGLIGRLICIMCRCLKIPKSCIRNEKSMV